MVRGIGIFRSYFENFTNNYIIIGGTACDIVIGRAGFNPRATRDIDIILVVEALTPTFVEQFWNFIKDGAYAKTEKNEGERKYYRFMKPANPEFPYQIELFSRLPDMLDEQEGTYLTPIPVEEDLSNLSAILMNQDYYNYVLEHSMQEEGIQRASIESLICLKSKAFLEMTERKEKGESVDDKHIRKHKGDVFRLSAMLTANDIFELPESIQIDMQAFADAVKNDLPDKAIFKEMGLGSTNPIAVLAQLVKNFNLKIE
jgi:hypothetical protein